MKKYRCDKCGQIFTGKSLSKRFLGESAKCVDPAPTLFGLLKGVVQQQCPECGSTDLKKI